MRIQEIISVLEDLAPPALQESYDNSGLLTGDAAAEASGALLTLDCTEAVIDEAIDHRCNLVIAHHPVIFSPLNRFTGANYVERTLIKAIRNNIALYACHTNLDNVMHGVNAKIAEKLNLETLRILSPKPDLLRKLVVFVPGSHLETVSSAVFSAGAGNIGHYDSCSFNAEGTGTFRGDETTSPFIGKAGELSREKEIRFETIFEAHREKAVVTALLATHPYEEVAYDIYPLLNRHAGRGSGMIGVLPGPVTENDFLALVKGGLKARVLRHTPFTGKKISTVAICGGSGRFLLKDALAAGADAFVTADLKYHEFFDAEGRLLLVDAGHFETEQFTPDIFYEILRKKFSTFAVRLSKSLTNPVNYYF